MTKIPMHQKKQYLLMIDDNGHELLSRLIPGLSFVPIEGVPLESHPNYNLLISPIQKPVIKDLSGYIADAAKMDEKIIHDVALPIIDHDVDKNAVVDDIVRDALTPVIDE